MSIEVSGASRSIRLVMFGRQGSGKGTQCARLAERFGVIHLSTGEILRDNITNGTELGRKVRPILAAGKLVDDETISELALSRLAAQDVVSKGYILDGYPRTLGQTETLLDALGPNGIDLALNLEVSLDEVRKRITSRGREDDISESVERRLNLYEVETVPVLDCFRDLGVLASVSGVGTMEEVEQRLVSEIESLPLGEVA